MNLQPISSTFASSLAGSVKAAAEKSSADAAETNTVQHQAAELQVDGVIKSNASEDSEADGRQLLDTFERRSQSQDKEEDVKQSHDEKNLDPSPKISDGDKPQRPRLDLQA